MPGRGGLSLGARFVLLAAFTLTLMIVDRRQDHLTHVRELLSLAVTPIYVIVDLPSMAWQSMTGAVADRQELGHENDQLRRQLLMAQADLQNLNSLAMENDRLRELLDSYEELSEDRVMIAEILSVDLDPYRQRFVINRGSTDDVYVGQPLLDARGVVGQVEVVSPITSEALWITDADHAIPVRIERSGFRAIAEGTGDSGQLRLPYVTNSADVRRGDLLVTSGLGGIFPSGRPVATIDEFVPRPDQNFAHVTATPVSALDRDWEVLLVWNDVRSAAGEVAANLERAVQ